MHFRIVSHFGVDGSGRTQRRWAIFDGLDDDPLRECQRLQALARDFVRRAARTGAGARVVRIRTLEQLAAWLLFSLAVLTVYGVLVAL
jgi:hypothetical protein